MHMVWLWQQPPLGRMQYRRGSKQPIKSSCPPTWMKFSIQFFMRLTSPVSGPAAGGQLIKHEQARR